MGTIVYRAIKEQVVHDELASVGVYSTVLAHRTIGNRLWFLAQTHSGAHAGRKWIGLTLIDCRGGEVAIKSMDETCGPWYYDCPLAFLAQADAPTGPYAGPWREKARAFHANRAARRSAIRQGHALPTALTSMCCGAASGAADGMSSASSMAWSCLAGV